jgi:hypothetical protein
MKKIIVAMFACIFSASLFAQEPYALVRMGKDWSYIDKTGSYCD